MCLDTKPTSSFFSIKPEYLSTSFPFLNKIRVGIDINRNFAASGFASPSSISDLAMTALSPSSAAAASSSGPSCTQPGHQPAQKSIKTGLSVFSASSKFFWVTCNISITPSIEFQTCKILHSLSFKYIKIPAHIQEQSRKILKFFAYFAYSIKNVL